MVNEVLSRLTKGLFSIAIPLGTVQVESISKNAVYWPPWGQYLLPHTYANPIAGNILEFAPVFAVLLYSGINILSAVSTRPKNQSIRETLKYIFNPLYDVQVETVEDESES
jgi:hypothetical protein